MRTALVIGGRPDYAGPAVRILPRTGARIYPSGHVYEAEVDDSINNNDQEQQLKLTHKLTAVHVIIVGASDPVRGPHPKSKIRASGQEDRNMHNRILALAYWYDFLALKQKCPFLAS